MIEAREIIEEIIKDNKQDGDYFVVRDAEISGWVAYSRYYCSGSYAPILKYMCLDGILIIEHLPATSGKKDRFNLADPDSFLKAGSVIKSIKDRYQTDRMPLKSCS